MLYTASFFYHLPSYISLINKVNNKWGRYIVRIIIPLYDRDPIVENKQGKMQLYLLGLKWWQQFGVAISSKSLEICFGVKNKGYLD